MASYITTGIFTFFIIRASCWEANVYKQKYFEGPELYINGTNCRNMDELFWCDSDGFLAPKYCSLVDDRIVSIGTKGKCLRIFEHRDCYGKTIALYPGNLHHEDLGVYDFANKTSSIGPCFMEDNCSPPYRRRRQISNDEICVIRFKDYLFYREDVLQVGHVPGLTVDIPDQDGGPIVEYQTGYEERMEYVQAVINRRHIGTGTTVTTDMLNYARQMGRSNDTAGYIIPRFLGGPGNVFYNIFPQYRYFNGGIWRNEEILLVNIVIMTGEVRLTVNLNYRHEKHTRPNLIVYKIEQIDSNGNYRQVLTNNFANPESD